MRHIDKYLTFIQKENALSDAIMKDIYECMVEYALMAAQHQEVAQEAVKLHIDILSDREEENQ